jgi:hypothetical protein
MYTVRCAFAHSLCAPPSLRSTYYTSIQTNVNILMEPSQTKPSRSPGSFHELSLWNSQQEHNYSHAVCAVSELLHRLDKHPSILEIKYSASLKLKHMGGLMRNTLPSRPPFPMRMLYLSFSISITCDTSAPAGSCIPPPFHSHLCIFYSFCWYYKSSE